MVEMNANEYIPFHSTPSTLHRSLDYGSESWLHRGAAAHPSPTCPNFHCDLLHESFLGPGSLVYRKRWPWTASSYYVDLCGMVTYHKTGPHTIHTWDGHALISLIDKGLNGLIAFPKNWAICLSLTQATATRKDRKRWGKHSKDQPVGDILQDVRPSKVSKFSVLIFVQQNVFGLDVPAART